MSESEVDKRLIGTADHEHCTEKEQECHNRHIQYPHALFIKQPLFKPRKQLLNRTAKAYCKYQEENDPIVHKNTEIPQACLGTSMAVTMTLAW